MYNATTIIYYGKSKDGRSELSSASYPLTSTGLLGHV